MFYFASIFICRTAVYYVSLLKLALVLNIKWRMPFEAEWECNYFCWNLVIN